MGPEEKGQHPVLWDAVLVCLVRPRNALYDLVEPCRALKSLVEPCRAVWSLVEPSQVGGLRGFHLAISDLKLSSFKSKTVNSYKNYKCKNCFWRPWPMPGASKKKLARVLCCFCTAKTLGPDPAPGQKGQHSVLFGHERKAQ